MKTSPIDAAASASLARLDGRDWVLASASGTARRMLIVPGTEVSIHWVDLGEGLTDAQAAAAARLMLSDATAEPLSEMHVAVGRREDGLTPVALASNRRMEEWIADRKSTRLNSSHANISYAV